MLDVIHYRCVSQVFHVSPFMRVFLRMLCFFPPISRSIFWIQAKHNSTGKKNSTETTALQSSHLSRCLEPTYTQTRSLPARKAEVKRGSATRQSELQRRSHRSSRKDRPRYSQRRNCPWVLFPTVLYLWPPHDSSYARILAMLWFILYFCFKLVHIFTWLVDLKETFHIINEITESLATHRKL